MGRQGIKLDKAHAFSSRFLQLCAQEEKALSQWGAIFHTTRQTISNWQTGESVPDIIKLADIAQYFGVSTDYLLGLSDTKSPDASAKAAVEYTGLSEEAVERLHSGLKDYELEEIQLSKDIIMCNQRITSALIECKEFPEIIGRLARAENSSLHEQMLHILCDQYIHEVEGEAEADDFLLFVNPEDRMLTEKLILYINKFQIPSSKLSKKLHMMSDDELIHTAISSAIAKRDNSELQQFVQRKNLTNSSTILLTKQKNAPLGISLIISSVGKSSICFVIVLYLLGIVVLVSIDIITPCFPCFATRKSIEYFHKVELLQLVLLFGFTINPCCRCLYYHRTHICVH